MSCLFPLKAYRSTEIGPSGKRGLTFNPRYAYGPLFVLPVIVPCGVCRGCRVAKAREYALRCSHEAKMHRENCFVTLTFDNDHFPADASVNVRDMQLFLKRLRFHYADKRIRYFGCGEYSPRKKRPHYHMLLFGVWFEDSRIFSVKNDRVLYISKILQLIWPFGFSTIGFVNYQTARYCAQYTTKKIVGKDASDHYMWPHPLTGEIVTVNPEFAKMSLKPGLGAAWYEQFKGDCFPSDFLIVDGKKHPVPGYYMRRLEKEDAGVAEEIRRLRVKNAVVFHADNTPERRKARAILLEEKLKRSSRNGELHEV